jgi:hypothetical protein
MRANQVTSRLWDCGLVYISEIQSILARGQHQRHGIERLTGDTVDTSEWLDFDLYSRIWYLDKRRRTCPVSKPKFVYGLGLTYRILTEAGNVLARSTVQHIILSDMATNAIKTRVHTFDTNVTGQLNDDKNFVVNHMMTMALTKSTTTVIFPSTANTGTRYNQLNLTPMNVNWRRLTNMLEPNLS